MRTVRIFVSSPADALDERRRVSRTVERLNGAFRNSVHLEAVRWEERFYSAHNGFQPQIPRSGECDLVIAILRGRLGSPLSQAFHASLPPEERLPNDACYPSGTAYEILTAIQQRQRGAESPDIYVFRWPEPPQVSLDAPDRAETEAQWHALKHFAEEMLLTQEGHFKGAYQSYKTLDDFETQVEALLRDWLKVHVLGERTVLWLDQRGSPFRGLEPFGMRHAAVFFGRTREIIRAVEKLKLAAGQGMPFQLVVGPSGAGKSSFVRAGLVPKLTAAGEVESVGAWRVALVRPGESSDGPVAALARRLFEATPEIESAEAGRPAALPELNVGAFATPEALARLLAHADETSAAPILATLARVAQAEKERWGTEKLLPARLLLVVDQLDEIFATAITDEQRDEFARLLEVLGRTGAVWIVATLRAEFYETFLKSPLSVLAGDERTLTLKPPGLAEMAEIVREPARAADLTWETDIATGERLDERLLADIDRPNLLPLLQFVLDRLYEKREGGNGQPLRLTFAAYQALGKLDGAIDMAGQQALAGLGATEQARLPRLLRALVTPAISNTIALTLQSVPLEQAAPDEAAQRLTRVLVNSRILVTSSNEYGDPLISLAHQRVIEAWKQAQEIISGSTQFYRVQEYITSQRKRWDNSKKSSTLLIPKGLPLAEAEQHVRDYYDEVSIQDKAFVKSSRRKANRINFVAASVAITSISLALFSLYQKNNAIESAIIANKSKEFSQNTLDSVVNILFPSIAYSNAFTSSESARRINSFVNSLGENLDESSANDASKRSIYSINYILSEMYERSGSPFIQIQLINKALSAIRAIKDTSDRDYNAEFRALLARGKSFYNISDYESSKNDLEDALRILETNIVKGDERKEYRYRATIIDIYMALLKSYVHENNAQSVNVTSKKLIDTIDSTWAGEVTSTQDIFDLFEASKNESYGNINSYIKLVIEAALKNIHAKGNKISSDDNESAKNAGLFFCKASKYAFSIKDYSRQINYSGVAKSFMTKISMSGDNWFSYNYKSAECMNEILFMDKYKNKSEQYVYYGPPEEKILDIVSNKDFSSSNISASVNLVMNSFFNEYTLNKQVASKKLIERSVAFFNTFYNRASLRNFDQSFNGRNIDLSDNDAIAIIDLLVLRLVVSVVEGMEVDYEGLGNIHDQIKRIKSYSRGIDDEKIQSNNAVTKFFGLIHDPTMFLEAPGDQIYCPNKDENGKCNDNRYREFYKLIESQKNYQLIISDYRPILEFVLSNFSFDDRVPLLYISKLLRSDEFNYIAKGGDDPFVFTNQKNR